MHVFRIIKWYHCLHSTCIELTVHDVQMCSEEIGISIFHKVRSKGEANYAGQYTGTSTM